MKWGQRPGAISGDAYGFRPIGEKGFWGLKVIEAIRAIPVLFTVPDMVLKTLAMLRRHTLPFEPDPHHKTTLFVFLSLV